MRDKKWVRVTVRIVGVLIAVFFTALLAGVIGSSIDEPEGWSLAETVGFSAFALVFAVFGVFLIFLVRRRLVVEGGVFSYLPTFGMLPRLPPGGHCGHDHRDERPQAGRTGWPDACPL